MTSSKQLNKISKFLSFVLRHKPEAIGLELDPNGWANINDLISKANTSDEQINLDRNLIQEVVETSDKKRFVISGNGQNIRANQGHSINVDLQLEPVTPPEFLYHGTATRFLDRILKEGLKPQQRQYVHLSTDIETASVVGQRYGKPVVLKIKSLLMHEQGFTFYLSDNGVWLTTQVPRDYLER
ncbi:RNA 2'-phosphotransferase [Microbulbifer thermotolerans]|uniref:RNA 2'-phosphotransferase n=1 Tax=Microbulbifer thermotolerans TaxID=252514 RepID=UPI002248CDCB|nr:RNA 2'-phosphotransferase [Microbulbifer thermotolerans]MCX2784652.1 RNA 2'-phosphotransferase [Microbulbifer thermotolerans]MCX2796512.1 RNA 2'-phosphotransferase [Microbulbifer thermotolerans]